MTFMKLAAATALVLAAVTEPSVFSLSKSLLAWSSPCKPGKANIFPGTFPAALRRRRLWGDLDRRRRRHRVKKIVELGKHRESIGRSGRILS